MQAPPPAPPTLLAQVAQVFTIIGAIFAAGLIFFTRFIPWLLARIGSSSLQKYLGSIFTKPELEKAIRYYVAPMSQDVDPAGGEEPRLVLAVRQKLFDVIDRALFEKTEFRYIILLADSGMGKTSALINYSARHLRRWRGPFKIAIVPLGTPDADTRIQVLEDQENTVLFLDAFDEDTLAIADHAERLRMLLELTKKFHNVLITCRTQFFPKDEELPRRTGIIRVSARAAGEPAEYLFHKIYLSPFSDKEIARYIRRRYPFWFRARRRKAYQLATRIPNLSVRPMLLVHLDDLIFTDIEFEYSYQLYEEMVTAWIEREKGFILDERVLREFSERLAVDLYTKRVARGGERIVSEEIAALSAEWGIPLESWSLTGRSLLNRDGEGQYKFAHRSIMEYLFVYRMLKGEVSLDDLSLTEQMEIFLSEMIPNESQPYKKLHPFLLKWEASPQARSAINLGSLLLKLPWDLRIKAILNLVAAVAGHNRPEVTIIETSPNRIIRRAITTFIEIHDSSYSSETSNNVLMDVGPLIEELSESAVLSVDISRRTGFLLKLPEMPGDPQCYLLYLSEHYLHEDVRKMLVEIIKSNHWLDDYSG
jgi:hypothetical protein